MRIIGGMEDRRGKESTPQGGKNGKGQRDNDTPYNNTFNLLNIGRL